VSNRILSELFSNATNDADKNYRLGQAAGMAVYKASLEINNEINALYELADQLSDKEYRRYRETLGTLPEKDFDYGLTDDNRGVNIRAYNGLGGKVDIPAELEGFPVTEVSISGEKWGEARRRITSVTLPKGVTTVTRGMFEGCTALSSVTLPSTLTSIERSAFADCASLASMTIPDRVTTIGRSPFIRSGLTSITWPARIPVIPLSAFYGTRLKTIVIPDGVTDISYAAFAECKELTSVTLPTTIKNIDAEAFRDCPALTSITIPASVTSLTFYGKYDGENAARPSGTQTNTGNGAFKGSKLGLATQARLKQLGYTGEF